MLNEELDNIEELDDDELEIINIDDIDDDDDDDDDEEYEDDGDGVNWGSHNYNKFASDCKDRGLDVYRYKGRFFYDGPAVNTSRRDDISLQDVLKATTVECIWDGMGLDLVVYPKG